VSGCSESGTISLTEGSKVVLIPDGDEGYALTFAAIIENNTNSKSAPFYVQFKIQDEWLNSKLEQDEFIVGESMEVNNSGGTLHRIDANSDFHTGTTLRVIGATKINKLKKTIEQNDSVKVNLLNEDKEIIQSDFINTFGKDLTVDGVDDTVQ
ncbi:hypothetical protein, partial [Virgibacillus litoralis]|uniref:hypothetical protein n=1 Tax=Virgibacillus litoralis TaxID=578221 RepID=UPI00360BD205